MAVTYALPIVNVNATVTAAPVAPNLQQSGAIISVGGTTLTAGTYLFCANQAAVTAILNTSGNYTELANKAAEFFAQPQAANYGVFILELGASGGVVATQITSLATWIAANLIPQQFYAYSLPAAWDSTGSAAINTLAGTYATPTSRTYFFIDTTSGHLSTYTNKSMFATVPSPTAAGTEVQSIITFANWICQNPSLATPAAPMQFRYAYGVTPWPLISSNGTSNSGTISTILSGSGNIIGTGSEGGISTAILRNGFTMDGNQSMFWYAIDYLLIQADLLLANALINASNNGSPIPYNQFGINTLKQILVNIGKTAQQIGLMLSTTFTAIPFTTYVAANPSNFAAGLYNGFVCAAVPQNGFVQITFNLNASQFIA